ncbi:MAG: DEAD/DEAH box helicase family protein [Saprospiraceae bacterium]|nr:DEAD/DEAH box helicase family protein [Saprospiraceae bacterium]
MVPSKNNEKLRDYQIEYKNDVYSMWEKHKAVMLQMPTGTGKTRLFASIVRDIHDYGVQLGKAFKVLIIVHRQELVDQAAQTLGVTYGVAHGIIMSGTRQQQFYPTQIASVQTISRRLKNWADKEFDFIIIDEAHHALAKSYLEICQIFRKAKILGVTATPYRMNGASFKSLFNELIVSKKVSEYIENGYLSKYDYFSIAPSSAIQKAIDAIDSYDIDGDYSITAMSRILDDRQIQSNLIDSYKKYAEGKKGIVYTINKTHNIHVRDAYIEAGYLAVAIDSDTSPNERSRIIQQFKSGRVKILCNVNIFSEGFDCPDVEFIQLARPTTSLSLYLQQVGRGLRTHPDIKKVIYLDNVGSYNKYGLPSSYRNWQRYFNGGFDNKDSHIEKDDLAKKNCTIYEIDTGNEIIIEGNKPVSLIYTTPNQKHIPNETYELTDFDDFEEFYIPKKVDVEDLDFWYFTKYNYDGWTSEEDYFEFDEPSTNKYKVPNKYSEFIERYKRVKINNKWGLYDCSSKELILPIIYDEISGANILGKSLIKENDKFGVFCVHSFKFDFDCEYDEIEFIQSKSRIDQCIVSYIGWYGIITYDLKIIVNFEYDLIYVANFSMFGEDIQLFAIKDNKDVIIDDNNTIITTLEIVKPIGQYYILKYREKRGIGNSNGEILFPTIFSSISYKNGLYKATKSFGLIMVFKEDLSLFMNEDLTKFLFVSEKYIVAQKNPAGCGLLDIEGNILIDFNYQDINIKEGIICARKDNLWHVIDIDGHIYSSSSKIVNAISEFKKSKIFLNNQYVKLEIKPENEKNKVIENVIKDQTIEQAKSKKQEKTISDDSNQVQTSELPKIPERKKRPRIKIKNDLNPKISERKKK